MNSRDKQRIINKARDIIAEIELVFSEDEDFAEEILSAIANCDVIEDCEED